MKTELLRKHIGNYLRLQTEQPTVFAGELRERAARKRYYSSWTPERLQKMSPAEFGELLSKLWAMRIWGNKAYVVEKLVIENGLPKLREALERLLWASSRFNCFQSSVACRQCYKPSSFLTATARALARGASGLRCA